MALSVRLFGLNAWSDPGAAGADGRRHGRAALRDRTPVVTARRPALIAGAVPALTPVAVLMFRFNNPDALLVLLLVAGAYAVVRAVETASTRWLVLAGALVGLRLPDQDAAGAARRARVRAGLPGRRADAAAPADRHAARGRLARCCCRPAGGSRSSSWCPPRCGPTSAARRTTASSS